MIGKMIDWLRDPALDNIDVDGADRLEVHRAILANKRMMREVFTEFHHLFHRLGERFFGHQAVRIEVGAGVAPIRDSYPDVLASDIVPGRHLDRVLNAEDMDFDDASVGVVYGQNCFHHFPHPDRFFSELERVLVPGGGAILLEPYYGPAASLLFAKLFKTEAFDKQAPSWDSSASGPMSSANQALSYIVFVRDRAEFERKHPQLKIVHRQLCGNHLKYLLSGGLNFRQLMPDWSIPLVEFAQWLQSPLNRWTSLHHVIVIRKVPA